MEVKFLTPCEGCPFESVTRMVVNGKEVCAIAKVFCSGRRIIWCYHEGDVCLAVFISDLNTSKLKDSEIQKLIEEVEKDERYGERN